MSSQTSLTQDDNNQIISPTDNQNTEKTSVGPKVSRKDGTFDQQSPSLKEQKEIMGSLKGKEKGPESVKYKEYQEVEVKDEVKDWMEKIETGEDVKLDQPVIDDYGQILLDNSTSQKPQIILPLEEKEIDKALHHKVVDSIRWLAEWCKRVVKVVGKRAKYPGR